MKRMITSLIVLLLMLLLLLFVPLLMMIVALLALIKCYLLTTLLLNYSADNAAFDAHTRQMIGRSVFATSFSECS